MDNSKIYKIEIWTRGKNRDEFGNPYAAYIAWLRLGYVSYARRIAVLEPMTGYDSSADKCLELAVLGINRTLGLNISVRDERIVQYHKHVYRDADLEHPEKWKIDLED